MRTIVLLIRHAAVCNPDQIFYGRLPRFGLSESGRRQAVVLAQFLESVPISVFYTSPLLRARQTAGILASCHPQVPIRMTASLNEVRTSWAGELATAVPPRVNLYEPPRQPCDETISDLVTRMTGFIRRLLALHKGQTACCVGHGDPIASLAASLRGAELKLASIRRPWHPEYCSVTRLVFEDPGSRPAPEYIDVLAEFAPSPNNESHEVPRRN